MGSAPGAGWGGGEPRMQPWLSTTEGTWLGKRGVGGGGGVLRRRVAGTSQSRAPIKWGPWPRRLVTPSLGPCRV